MSTADQKARDRISLLLDQDSPFLEVCAFAGYENSESTPGANIIAGIGNVCGKSCFLLSHVPTSQGGAWNSMTGMLLFHDLQSVRADSKRSLEGESLPGDRD
jgi:acetyl-CoA carboxylase carboxyltransferase component